MYYVEMVRSILASKDISDCDKFLKIVEDGFRAQVNFDKTEIDKIPDEKDDGLRRLIIALEFLNSRRVPVKFWEDLCPGLPSIGREYIDSEFTDIAETKRLPVFESALRKTDQRAKDLAQRGIYTLAQYNSWFFMGDH